MIFEQERSVRQYLKELRKHSPLTREEEEETLKRVGKGDRAAAEKLVTANLRFVVKIALEYQGRGIPLGDLIGAGNAGLIKALDRFDEKRGYKFISYAVWWIRQAILTALVEQPRIVRIPSNSVELLRKAGTAQRRLAQERGRDASPEELAQALGVSESSMRNALARNQPPLSLEADMFPEDHNAANRETPLHSRLIVEQELPSQKVEESDMRADVSEALDALEPREQEVIRLYFGIGEDEPLTLEEIGARLNLTRERVRQLKKRALCRLKSQNKNLEPHWEQIGA